LSINKIHVETLFFFKHRNHEILYNYKCNKSYLKKKVITKFLMAYNVRLKDN